MFSYLQNKPKTTFLNIRDSNGSQASFCVKTFKESRIFKPVGCIRLEVFEEQLSGSVDFFSSVIMFTSHYLFITRAKQLKYSKTTCYSDHVFVNNCWKEYDEV